MKSHDQIVTRNLQLFYREIADGCNYEYRSSHGLDIIRNPQGSWPANILGTPATEDIPWLKRSMQDAAFPSFLILDTGEPLIRAELEHAGIRPIRQWLGMYMDAGDFVAEDKPVELELRVNDVTGLEDWFRLTNEDLLSGTYMGEEVMDALQKSDAFSWVVGYHEGLAVSAGLIFSDGAAAGFYMIVTRSESRGRGYASRLFDELVSVAINAGNKALVLQASGMGESIYRRKGFRPAGSYHIMWNLEG